MSFPHRSTNITLRSLALIEADKELVEAVLPCPPFSGSWQGRSTEELKSTLAIAFIKYIVNLRVTATPKQRVLYELLEAINAADLDGENSTDSKKEFLDEHGVDRDQYWDEKTDLSPTDKLMEAIFSRKQRPPFYYKVEELCEFLDEKSAMDFRASVVYS